MLTLRTAEVSACLSVDSLDNSLPAKSLCQVKIKTNSLADSGYACHLTRQKRYILIPTLGRSFLFLLAFVGQRAYFPRKFGVVLTGWGKVMLIKFIKAILRELSSPQEDGLFIQASSTEFDLAETFHQNRYLHNEVRQPDSPWIQPCHLTPKFHHALTCFEPTPRNRISL
jgi:hypothetical protein